MRRKDEKTPAVAIVSGPGRPRCHACGGVGDVLSGTKSCVYCDEHGRAKRRCNTCSEYLPGCKCFDSPHGNFRSLGPCDECGERGVVVRDDGRKAGLVVLCEEDDSKRRAAASERREERWLKSRARRAAQQIGAEARQ